MRPVAFIPVVLLLACAELPPVPPAQRSVLPDAIAGTPLYLLPEAQLPPIDDQDQIAGAAKLHLEVRQALLEAGFRLTEAKASGQMTATLRIETPLSATRWGGGGQGVTLSVLRDGALVGDARSEHIYPSDDGGLPEGAKRLINTLLEAKGFHAPAPSSPTPTVATGSAAHSAESQATAKQGRVLAVLELHDRLRPEDRAVIDLPYFSDQIRAAALRADPALNLITRENLLVLLQARGKSASDCEGECEVDTGRRVGADFVVSGEALKVGTKLKLNLKLHDTHSGRLLSGATASGKDVDELDADVRKAVGELAQPLHSAPAAMESALPH